MELPYDSGRLHNGRCNGQATGSTALPVKEVQRKGTHTKEASTLQLATGFLGTLVAQAARLPSDAINTVTQFALRPARAVSAAHGLIGNEHNERLAKRTRLLQQLCNATGWTSYRAACIELDRLEDAQSWKETEPSELYDVDCLRGRLKRLSSAIDRDDVRGMVSLIRSELTRDLGGICNPALHQQSRMGTKYLIQHYMKTVEQVLDRIVRSCSVGDQRLLGLNVQAEIEETRCSYGRTALLLSGGGTLGMNHIGVVKSLFEAGALPRIISGSSSGSIVAAVLGATSDNNLLEMLHEFCHGDLAVFIGAHEKKGWQGRLQHLGKTGHLFDLGNLRRVMADLLGKITFLEAYNRTRRVLNITVSNSASYESQQVLNYATAKDVVIWSAVVASCAVPFGFDPERLLYKQHNAALDLVPWDPFNRYVDGSINGDLPTSILSAEFDVNHSIVSQVNPHVTPFLTSVQEDRQHHQIPYWLGFAGLAKEEAIHAMEILSDMPHLEQSSNIGAKLTSVLAQRYTGDITLVPTELTTRIWHILENPTPESMEMSTLRGERATWSVVDMIKTHMTIELLIDNTLRKVSEHVAFSRSATALRKAHIGRVSTHTSGGRLRSRKAGLRGPLVDQIKDRRGHRRRKRTLSPELHRSKIAITPAASTSRLSLGSSGSIALESDDEADLTEGLLMAQRRRTASSPLASPEIEFLAIQTQPSTPTSSRSYFNTSRSGSPARKPASLLMTPVTPRAQSPEATYKRPPSVNSASRVTLSATASMSQLSLESEQPPSWRSKLLSMSLPKSAKRASRVAQAKSRARRRS